MEQSELREAMVLRHSVRRYLPRAIEADKAAILRQVIDACNAAGGLHIQLVLDEPKAFGSKLYTYGQFKGVTNYVAMVCRKGDDTRLGYYGERVVLAAQTLGLNSCWVGLTFKQQKDRYEVLPGEKLVCLVALGYGDGQGVAHPQKKGPDHYYKAAGAVPQWFMQGVEAALLAPTAINQQKFLFTLLDDRTVLAERTPALNSYGRIDLGIAMCHFELGAGSDSFVWDKTCQP